MKVPRVGLVGIGGYGQVHLRHLLHLHALGEIVLAAAVVLPVDEPLATEARLAELGCVIFAGFDELCAALPRLNLQLGVVPTPIHLHAPMTLALLDAGLNVLLEKPLAASLPDAAAIASRATLTRRKVAVGFQYLHAPEVRALKEKLVAGEIGVPKRFTVFAAWPRSYQYYTRNSWAGRIRVGSHSVLDSPVNNAMSHFMMLMLYLAGTEMTAAAKPVRMSAELYRVQEIESFDTGVVRCETANKCRLDFYGTHSSREVSRPALVIEGTEGTAEWVQDSHASVENGRGSWKMLAFPESDTRERMLRDVLANIRGESVFICSPELASAHTRCVVALHEHVPITPIPLSNSAERTAGGMRYRYLPGLDEVFSSAAKHGVSLADTGAPWATTPVDVHLT